MQLHENQRLSGRIVGQLDLPGQFVLWAFRQRAVDGRAGSEVLVTGFRLLFGLERLEHALSLFERLFSLLGFGNGAPVLPLRCAFLGRAESRLIDLVLTTTREQGCRDCLGCPLGQAIVAFTDLLRAALAEHRECPPGRHARLH